MRVRPGARTCIAAALVLAGLAIFYGPQWSVSFCHSRARAAIARRHWPRAELWLSRARQIAPANSRTFFLRARLARKRGRVDEAADDLQRARQFGYPVEALRREVWLAEAQTGRLSQLEAHLSELLIDPGDDAAEICEAYVHGCILNYRFDPARQILELWQADFPRDPQPHYLRGRIREHLGDLERATQEHRRALELDPRYPAPAYNLARLLLTQQHPEQALELYRTCARNLFDPQPGHVGAAQCLRLLGRPDEARRELELAVAGTRPFAAEAWRLVGEPGESAAAQAPAEFGRLELAAKNYARAADWFEQALAAHPQDWKTRYSYSTALRALGRTADAARESQRVQTTKQALAEGDRLFDQLRAHPDDADVRFQLGRIFLRHVSENQGLVWLNSALYFDPEHRPTHQLLAAHFAAKAVTEPRFASLAEQHRKHSSDTPASEPGE